MHFMMFTLVIKANHLLGKIFLFRFPLSGSRRQTGRLDQLHNNNPLWVLVLVWKWKHQGRRQREMAVFELPICIGMPWPGRDEESLLSSCPDFGNGVSGGANSKRGHDFGLQCSELEFTLSDGSAVFLTVFLHCCGVP